MTKIEYWDMGSTIFSKTTKDGIIEGTESKPKEEWPNDIVKALEKNHGTMVVESDKGSIDDMFKEAEEEQEQLSKGEASLTQEELDKTIKTSPVAVTESIKDNNDAFMEAVKKPKHYQGITISGKNGSMEFEAIEIIDSVVNMLDFNPAASHAIGDALKYILRCGKKESDNNTTTDLMNKAKQDLLKSSWYTTRAANVL